MRVLFPFLMEVLRALNVTPSHLFHNSWGFIKVFWDDMRWPGCNFYRKSLFLFLYHKNCEGQMALGGLLKKTLFTSHSNHYKYWKDIFACMMGQDDSLGVSGANDAPFPPCPRRRILWRSCDMTLSSLPLRKRWLSTSCWSLRLWNAVQLLSFGCMATNTSSLI